MSGTLDFSRCYASSYRTARARFRRTAADIGAELSAYTHPFAEGPDGGSLSVDVAHIGDPKAPRQLVVVSGTHGLEGYAGSASQIAWMLGHGQVPDGVSVLMVHGINPYGFAHGTRTTEHNVDLNRNFVDHAAPYPENAGYGELHEQVIPDDWSPDAMAQVQAHLEAFGQAHGADALFDVMARGQYTHPDGIIYGGDRREWSNLTLQAIVDDHLGAAEVVGLIDWHTGIGDYKDMFFLCFNEEGGDLHDEACRWWGRERIVGQRPHGLARPNYQGLVFNGVRDFVGERPMIGAVIEFGTYAPLMRAALILDVWLKSVGDPDPDRVALLKQHLFDAFVPVSADWRQASIAHALGITQEAVDGLASWSPSKT
ncbi:hypothetical protein AB7M35_001964 [Amorphus suaedae]